MLRKIALSFSNVSPLENTGSNYIIRTAASGRINVDPSSEVSRIVSAEIKKHPNALFFEAKAIEANVMNSNGDYFSEEELLKSYKTFEGVPIFTNHNNQNIENARGKVIFARWNPEDKSVYTVAFVDRDAYPDICRGIEEEYVSGVSMGTSVEYSVCNICENRAEKTENYCFIPGTTITMADFSVKNIENITVGDNVLDAFGCPTVVTRLFKHDVSETLISISSKAIDGKLTCTKNHPFLVERLNKLIYMPCEYIVDGEPLLTPIPKIEVDDSLFDIFNKYEIENNEKNRLMLSKLIGYYIAEGSLIHNSEKVDIGIALSLHSEEIEYRDEIINICQKLLHKSPEIVDRNNYNPKCIDIRIYHNFIVDLVKLTCAGKAKDKTLSKSVLYLSKPYLQEIVAGYIDCDGYSDKKYGRMVITTASRNLASQMLYLLNYLGISPSIYSYMQNNGPNDREGRTEIFRISIGHLKTLEFRNSSIKVKKSQLIAEKSIKVNCAKTNFSINGFSKHAAHDIEEVEYNGPVYNFETESHSYVANNTSVHNCTHIREKKGRKFSGKARNVVTGEINTFKDQPVYEYNYGLKFIELSAVVDPACPTCHIQGIIHNDDFLNKAANIENTVRDYLVKTASVNKTSSKKEIDELEGVLQTLENIAINLIKNRKQVEMEFSTDLVEILSNLQTWVDELVGAGYSNLPESVPGTAGNVEETPQSPAQAPQAAVPAQPAQPLPAATEGTAEATPASATAEAAPSSSAALKLPKLPITTPIRPKASQENGIIEKVAENSCSCIINSINKLNKDEMFLKVASLNEKLNNMGDIDMSKRRTLTAKNEQKERVMQILSNSWQEKQDFFEYIKEMPSIQDNENRLTISKKDDSFIIVAENKIDSEDSKMVWTYEDLSEDEKKVIKNSPREASIKLLETFSSLNKKQKEGDNMGTEINKSAGANSVNKAPEVITEKQLEQKDLYHARTGTDVEQITQAQLEAKRKGEQEVVTEKQLDSKREGSAPEVVGEKQLEAVRENADREQVTQAQLNDYRKNAEPEVVTEKQLKDIASPWARAANRDPAMFKSAADHMASVVDVIANTVIAAGCTPEEVQSIAASMVDSTKNRYHLAASILDQAESKEDINYAKRLAFWNNKNLKVASAGIQQIAEILVGGLRKIAKDVTMNPDVLIDAIDVVCEEAATSVINKKIEEKLAASATVEKKTSRKEELRKALLASAIDAQDGKGQREIERKEILAALEKGQVKQASYNKILSTASLKGADTMIETNFIELGSKKDSPSFKKDIVSFAKGALASQNIKLAAVTNVTISGDTIQIAVQTDEGDQAIEIPVGDTTAPANEETIPEGDLSGEGLENTMGSEVPPPAPAPAPAATMGQMASSKKTVKIAQSPMGGGVPGTPGGVAASGAPEQGLPGPTPQGDAVQSLTTDTPEDKDMGAGEIPTVGEVQMPWTICPECGSSDVDVTNEKGDIHGNCQKCGAEYEALLKKEVEFKIIKPTVSVGKTPGEGEPEAPAEVPEVPALPVAAQTRIDKGSIRRIGSNVKAHGHVCPACGKKECKASKDQSGHTEYTCPACKTEVVKDILVEASNPKESYLRVKWDIRPNTGCKGCEEKAAKFASSIKMGKLLKSAAANKDTFPMENCIERMARKFGGNTVASFGPCKGKALADCVCKSLQKLAFSKVKDMVRLAEASLIKDPMDECIADQKKQGYKEVEAKDICNCIKKANASEHADNIYVHAFGKDIVAGTEDRLSKYDLITLKKFDDEAAYSHKKAVVAAKEQALAKELDEDISSALPSLEAEVEVELVKEATSPITEKTEAKAEVKEVVEAKKETAKEVCEDECKCGKDECEKCKEKAEKVKEDITAMASHRVLKVGEEIVKIAKVPVLVKDIEGNVEAGVPRKESYLGKEKEADSMINKNLNQPNVPRKEAYMGQEQSADSHINKPLKMPDLPIDNSFMGEEGTIQKGMPGINSNIKGTVIAKQMKQVDSVEGNVDVPKAPNGGKLGKEKDADSLINTPNKGPDVPRKEEYLGKEKEADSMINTSLKGPDVPIDNAYMGEEKEIQKDMPAINDEMLKVVRQQTERNDQISKIAKAREQQATRTAAWLVANSRLPNDMESYENAIKALSVFEIDKIASVADSLFPIRTAKVASTQASESKDIGHAIPAIVLESKSGSKGLQERLASAFTIGSRDFDQKLTMFGEKE